MVLQLDAEPVEAVRPTRVVDADSHMKEPHDLWTRRVPASMRDRVPHVAQVDGAPAWVVGSEVLSTNRGGVVVDRDGAKTTLVEVFNGEWDPATAHPAADDPVARLELLDQQGIWAQVVFPAAVGLGGDRLTAAVPDPAWRLDLLRIFNDHNAEVVERTGGRHVPLAIMPAWDVAACVAEVERAAGMGLRGVNMTSDPQDQGAPDLGHRSWDDFWAACAQHSMPVHFHIANSGTAMSFFGNYPWASHDDHTKLAIGGTLLFVGNARVVVNIISGGILERHPALRVVSVESGGGWIPFILEALDYEMAENAPRQMAELSMAPSDYFRRQISATTWFERRDITAMVRAVGADNLLWETDFPHPTCLYPDPLATADANLAGLPAEDRRKILGDNAAALYRL
jgi:predicted TIM-barrel fold metal-dependent hydrolase